MAGGSFHPSNFNYPSLPAYLAAGGMAVGFLRAAGRMEIKEVQAIGNVGYPHYQTLGVVQGAGQLFALLSVIALAATGVSAWLALRRPVLVLLAPLILLSSSLYFNSGWTYLNVDIVGACWVMVTIAACLLGTRHPSIGRLAVIPGAFAGLAAASKYSLAVVVLPVLLAAGFQFAGARRLQAWGAGTRFAGQERANVLNDLARRWRVIESFGTNAVLVNYANPVPFGDAAFAVAVLK